MTTKPKAKRFRIRRPANAAAPEAPRLSAAGAAAAPAGATPTASAAETQVRSTAQQAQQPQQRRAVSGADVRSGVVDSAAQIGVEQALDKIRREGLTGRQLRMARRIAQKHGLSPTSDFEAVYLLRKKGIDPFQRDSALDLMMRASKGNDPETSGEAKAQAKPPARLTEQKKDKSNLPQTVPHKDANLPSTDTRSPAERRAEEIRMIQRDMAKRRRRKMLLLLTRLSFFVFLPTLIVGWYFYAVATPMYSSKSEFLILKAESGGNAMGGLLSGTQFATNQDAIAVQSYLTSKDAMLRLDRDVGFKSHFSQDWIDPLQRLDDDPTNEQAFRVYKKHVVIGYDPTEGVIRMEVSAADPQVAADFSTALIGYAEERVDNLSVRKRANAVKDAQAGLDEAEAERRAAQEKLVRLQQESSIVDPKARIAALQAQVNNVETQLQEKNLQLQALMDNARPNRSRVEGTQADIRRLEALRDQINQQMTSTQGGEDSLAELAVQIQLAEADLATRDLMLSSALERLDQARRDADSQARYLTTSVYPLPSQDPSYPRSFENTVLAFLIFSGVYLMFSLTASILREQVSS